MQMGGINFYCQNINVCLPSSFGMALNSEGVPTGQSNHLNVTYPPVANPAHPNLDHGQPVPPICPTCQQPMIPIPPNQHDYQPIYPTQNDQQPMSTYVNPSLPETTQGLGSGSFSVQLEEGIFNLVNRERIKHGLPTVSQSPILINVARRKSQDMGEQGYFDHQAPDGTTTDDWLKNEGHSFTAWGENIADFGTNVTAEEMMDGWMNSPGHRANILKPEFTLLGVGVYMTHGRAFATQVFGR